MLSCSEYDHIEIVCMHQYPIKLTMKVGGVIEGKALDTGYNDQRQECIKVDTGSVEEWVVLAELASLAVCVDNPHFKQVSFT